MFVKLYVHILIDFLKFCWFLEATSDGMVSIQLHGEQSVMMNEIKVINGSLEFRSGWNVTFAWSLWVRR